MPFSYERARRELLKEQEELREQLKHLQTAEYENIGHSSHMAEDATEAFEQAMGVALRRKIVASLEESERALEKLASKKAQAGDAFDHQVGGVTPSGGEPVRIRGKLVYFGPAFGYERVAAVEFGKGNTVVITPAYEQVIRPKALEIGPVDPDAHDVIVVKSRVHFRRGFDETGYAPTIVVVEAPEPFVGTTFLDALPYEHVDLETLYPYQEAASAGR